MQSISYPEHIKYQRGVLVMKRVLYSKDKITIKAP